MPVNSSSTFTDLLVYLCYESNDKPYAITGFFAVKIFLILPLSTFILYLAHQQWRQQRSFNTASHSDLFTYHVSAMEMLWVIGSVCLLCGDYMKTFAFFQIGLCFSAITFFGEMCFHVLTCVERYLAVVHPVTYRGLRNARGVRIRNISVACVWLLCFVMAATYSVDYNHASIILLFFMPFCLVVISFCSLSVLCALIRPGPGEGGGAKERVDQLKQRAFNTITAISGVLWLWFIGILAATALDHSALRDSSVNCAVSVTVNWLNLPCSLMLPLMFLHRAGKLPCCCFNAK